MKRRAFGHVGDVHIRHLCRHRSPPAKADQRFDLGRIAVEEGLDRSIAAVPNPTIDPELAGLAADEGPIADALDPSPDAEVNRSNVLGRRRHSRQPLG